MPLEPDILLAEEIRPIPPPRLTNDRTLQRDIHVSAPINPFPRVFGQWDIFYVADSKRFYFFPDWDIRGHMPPDQTKVPLSLTLLEPYFERPLVRVRTKGGQPQYFDGERGRWQHVEDAPAYKPSRPERTRVARAFMLASSPRGRRKLSSEVAIEELPNRFFEVYSIEAACYDIILANNQSEDKLLEQGRFNKIARLTLRNESYQLLLMIGKIEKAVAPFKRPWNWNDVAPEWREKFNPLLDHVLETIEALTPYEARLLEEEVA